MVSRVYRAIIGYIGFIGLIDVDRVQGFRV